MFRVLEVSLGFPTVIFTTLLLISLGYWLMTTLLGFGDAPELDLDLDVDVDLDLDLDAGGAGVGGLGGALVALNLHLLPLSLGITLISLFGWLTSVILSLVLSGDDGSTNTLIGLAVIAGSFFVGIFATGRIGHLLRPIFEVKRAVRRQDLIGRLCTISTGRVDANFGQAELVDAEGGAHLIQVRCRVENSLSKGSNALLVAVDEDGLFTISPDIDALT